MSVQEWKTGLPSQQSYLPEEFFIISSVVVGQQFGTVVSTVYAQFLPLEHHTASIESTAGSTVSTPSELT